MLPVYNKTHWVDQLAKIEGTKSLPSSHSHSLYKIVRGFKHAVEVGESKYTTEDMARKVHFLTQSKLEYYMTARFGSIFEFFSALRNQFAMGVFKSSAQLGFELSNHILARIQRERSLTHPRDSVCNKCEPFLNTSSLSSSGKSVEHPTVEQPQTIAVDLPKIDEEVEKNDSLQLVPPAEIPKKDAYTLMQETIGAMWKEAVSMERDELLQVWSCMMRGAKVVKWEEVPGQTNGTKRYYLELQEKIIGKNMRVIGNTIICKSMLMEFLSEKDKKTIFFPEQRIVHRVSKYRLSVEVPLKKIIIRKAKSDDGSTPENGLSLTCVAALSTPVTWLLNILGRSSYPTLTSEATKNFWNGVVWQKAVE